VNLAPRQPPQNSPLHKILPSRAVSTCDPLFTKNEPLRSREIFHAHHSNDVVCVVVPRQFQQLRQWKQRRHLPHVPREPGRWTTDAIVDREGLPFWQRVRRHLFE
jgi:hypothetical protein